MTVAEIAKEVGRPISTVNGWIAKGHLTARWFQPLDPDGKAFGSPFWFVAEKDWLTAKPVCLTLKRGRPLKKRDSNE